MNKQPTPRICMTGCFRLTEGYVSPAQKFRVLVEELRDIMGEKDGEED